MKMIENLERIQELTRRVCAVAEGRAWGEAERALVLGWAEDAYLLAAAARGLAQLKGVPR